MTVESKFSVGNRVVIADKNGPKGTVQRIRVETTRDSIKKDGQEAPGVTVTVLWDNGTTSHCIPDSLELAE